MKKIACLMLVLAMIGCLQTSTNNGTDCAAAEKNLVSLGCISPGKYTQTQTFTEFCNSEINYNIYMSTACLANITSCSQINNCLQNKDRK